MEVTWLPKATYFRVGSKTFEFESSAVAYARRNGYDDVQYYDEDMCYLYSLDWHTIVDLND